MRSTMIGCKVGMCALLCHDSADVSRTKLLQLLTAPSIV